jgi:hypothetical protein
MVYNTIDTNTVQSHACFTYAERPSWRMRPTSSVQRAWTYRSRLVVVRRIQAAVPGGGYVMFSGAVKGSTEWYANLLLKEVDIKEIVTEIHLAWMDIRTSCRRLHVGQVQNSSLGQSSRVCGVKKRLSPRSFQINRRITACGEGVDQQRARRWLHDACSGKVVHVAHSSC